ncbi:MAG: prolyl oligopeptidase family serine peptidase, partial [Bdellovibrionota bacterium]
KAYPNVLVSSGLHDSQVQYWEPTKWAAKLRKLNTNNALILLHTEMDAGHSGASGRFEAIKDTALSYAFFLFLDGNRK